MAVREQVPQLLAADVLPVEIPDEITSYEAALALDAAAFDEALFHTR